MAHDLSSEERVRIEVMTTAGRLARYCKARGQRLGRLAAQNAHSPISERERRYSRTRMAACR